MAQYSNTAPQTVLTNQNVLYSETPARGNKCIVHRDGSGVVSLKGAQNGAMYRVMFSGNVAIPTGGAVVPITVAISLEGEALGSGIMTTTPAATDVYQNIAAGVVVCVPACCCLTLSVRNTGAGSILVENASLIVDRVA